MLPLTGSKAEDNAPGFSGLLFIFHKIGVVAAAATALPEKPQPALGSADIQGLTTITTVIMILFQEPN